MSSQPESESARYIRLDWTPIDKVPVMFANQVLIQHLGQEFVLSFGVATPPPFVGPGSEERLKTVDQVTVMPVTRIAMTPEKLLDLIRALQENYRNYQQVLAKQQRR